MNFSSIEKRESDLLRHVAHLIGAALSRATRCAMASASSSRGDASGATQPPQRSTLRYQRA